MPSGKGSEPAQTGGLLDAAVTAVGGTTAAGPAADGRPRSTRRPPQGEHLLVQAGHRHRQVAAYLVPAIAHAIGRPGPVVVSTATLALQAQIVDRDLPRLAEALAPLLGRRPTWQLVKGRRNDLCRQKLLGGFPERRRHPVRPLPPRHRSGRGPARPGGGQAAGQRDRPLARVGGIDGHRRPGRARPRGQRAGLAPGVGAVRTSAWGAQRCPMAAECFSERPGRGRTTSTWWSRTTPSSPSTRSRAGRCCPSTTCWCVDEGHELADRVTSVISDELTVPHRGAAGSKRVRQAE